jgi:phosphonate transport system permease protein
LSALASLLGAFFPPILTPAYLLALGGPIVETLGLTFGAMTLAFAAGLPLGVAAGLRLPGTRAMLGALAALRAIPDLTLAILCVIVLGVGPGAGLIALALYYGAAVSKIFADILRTAPAGPVEALAGTGASPLQVAVFGLIPARLGDLLAYGAYEVESALRASIVVGAVGGGGLGAELVGSLQAFDLKRVTTLLIVLLLLVGAFDRLAAWLRRHPRWLATLVPIGLVSLVALAPRVLALRHGAEVISHMLPPQLTDRDLARLPGLVWETLWMAGVGTAGAILAGALAGVLGARSLSPPWLVFLARRAMEALRTIPEVVFGLVLITLAGVGPLAGALALGLHSTGSLARLFADALDNAPRGPQQAIAQTGASKMIVAAYATIPLALGPLAAHALFRLEWNLRMATVLGLIGAGGVGQALYEAQQLFFYRQMVGWLLVTWALVGGFDAVSERVRRRWGLRRIIA